MKSAFIILALLFTHVDQPLSYKTKQDVNLGKSGLLRWVDFEGKRYLVCEVDPRKHNIETLNRLENGEGTYTFSEIAKQKGNQLIFAMNAGMYEKDLSPVGLFISGGKTYNDINLNTGQGNFYQLKPNGVFLIDKQNVAHVITSASYSASQYLAKLATQSGPMLVIDGAFNTNFQEHSVNVNIRNGVGVNKKGNVLMVISTEPVNFYEFAKLFKTNLACNNALYLDGVVSQYYAPELQSKPQPGVQLGTFLVVKNLSTIFSK